MNQIALVVKAVGIAVGGSDDKFFFHWLMEADVSGGILMMSTIYFQLFFDSEIDRLTGFRKTAQKRKATLEVVNLF